jgi:hypothetical protein
MAKREVEVKLTVDSQEAVKGTNQFNDKLKQTDKVAGETKTSLSGVSDGLEGVGGATGGAIQGVKGLLKGFQALALNPIGLILTAIVGVVTLLGKSFTRTEEGGNKMRKGMAMLSGAFSGLLSVLEPVASFIVDKVVGAFEVLGDVADWVLESVGKGLNALGFDEAAKDLDKWTKSIEDNQKAAMKLADMDAELIKLKREQGQIDLKTRLEAEKLRQVRDDESKSFAVRKKANEDLGKVLQKGAEMESAIVDKQLAAALLRQKIEGASTEVLDEIAEAKMAILEVDERIAGFESEKLANDNALRNEAKGRLKEQNEAAKVKLKQAEDEKELANKKVEEEKQRILDIERAKFESEQRTIQADAELKILRAEMGLEDPNKTADEHAIALEEKIAAMQMQYEAEKELKLLQFEESGITKEEQRALLELSEQEHQNRLDNIKDESRKKQDANSKKSFDDKLKMRQAYENASLNLANTTLGALSSLAEKGSAEQKAFAIGQATINTYQGITKALAETTDPTPTQSLRFMNAAAVGIAGFAQVTNILRTNTQKKSGGGSSSIGSLNRPASAPSINTESLFSTQNLESQQAESLGNQAGINQQKVVVLESDITSTVNNVKVIENDSEI